MRSVRFERLRVGTACTAIGIGVTLALALPSHARACSKAYFIGIRGPRDVHFLGTARTDTIAAGAGDIKYRAEGGHFGHGRDRAIYGQLVDVEQLGSWRPEHLRALGTAVRQVILVPWDYAADCSPVPWSQTARWVPPGSRGHFEGTLRDSAHWVDGIPTLDVHTPEASPYPRAVERSELLRFSISGRGTGPDLTAEQLFALYNVLPTEDELEKDVEGALGPLREWRRDHADQATPARGIVQSVLWRAERHRVRAIRSPVAGTYRLTVLLPDRDSLVFFARTGLHPSSTLDALTDSAQKERWIRREDPKAVGYYLMAQVASTLAELPRRVARFPDPFRGAADSRDPLLESQGSVAVVEVPANDTPDSTVWQGSVDLLQHAVSLAPSSALREAIAAAAAELWDQVMTGQRSYAPGHFVRRRDGSVRYTMIANSDGRPVVTMRGERISLDYLSDP